MNVTDILLAASVGCNLWFLFLLLYDKIMETKFVRFLTSITGLWRSLEDRGTIPETVQGEAPKNENDIIGKSRFKMASTRTNTATPVQEAATSEKVLSCQKKRLLLTTETGKPPPIPYKSRKTNSKKPSRA